MDEGTPVRSGRIETVDQVKALSNPLRVRILRVAGDPVSARHIAEHLGVPITRLYYHLDLLEDAGFLEVAEVRKSGAQLERLYRRTADRFDPSDEFTTTVLAEPGGATLLAGVIAEPMRVELEALIDARRRGVRLSGDATRAVLQLTPDLVDEYLERSRALIEEFVDRSGDAAVSAETYALTQVFAPLDGVAPAVS